MAEAERPYCRELERSRLWSGRMCWGEAWYVCEECGKPVCHEHKWEDGKGRVYCVSCVGQAVAQ